MNNSTKQQTELHVFAFSSFGKGLSGGDNIFIELSRRWSRAGVLVTVHIFQDGYDICRRAGLDDVNYKIYKGGLIKSLPLMIIVRSIRALVAVLKLKWTNNRIYIYSSSDFWPDVLPAYFVSKFFNKFNWIAGFFMFAPSPFKPKYPYKGMNIIRGILYYFLQMPAYFLVRTKADYVFVTSQPDVEKFLTARRGKDKILVIKGGVDLDFIKSVSLPSGISNFDAVFMGRLHPQKGVFELLEIWKMATELKHGIKLAIIGDGYLKQEIENRIKALGLSDNVTMFGYKFGEEKIRIFKSSKIVLHPAVYDSGGMAACEAMACGLPAISFDLEALKTYYPKGMIKIKCFDLHEFSKNIVQLLDNAELYLKLKNEAVELIESEWDWNKRAKDIYSRVFA